MKVKILENNHLQKLEEEINAWTAQQTKDRKLVVDIAYAVVALPSGQFLYSALITYND